MYGSWGNKRYSVFDDDEEIEARFFVGRELGGAVENILSYKMS